jgi:hypothetical protein
MAKLGRPFVYQSEEEKPVTVSLRVPRDLYEQAQRYVSMRLPMTLTELLLDGLRLRLETPTDPRDLILSDDNNTVMLQLQDMVDAAVQAALAKVSGPTTPNLDTQKSVVAPEAREEPIAYIKHYDNSVLQEKTAQPQGRHSDSMRPRILTLLSEHPEGLSAEQIRGHLNPEKPIRDTLQGMRKSSVVRIEGSGKKMRYFVA